MRRLEDVLNLTDGKTLTNGDAWTDANGFVWREKSPGVFVKYQPPVTHSQNQKITNAPPVDVLPKYKQVEF